MTIQENRLIARSFFTEGINNRNADVFGDLLAPNTAIHDPLSGEPSGPAGMVERMELLSRAFPDLFFIMEDAAAEDDKIAVRWVMNGTHRGELSGIAPTGRAITLSGASFFRIVAGRIVELWMDFDLLALLQQLGAVPSIRLSTPETADRLR